MPDPGEWEHGKEKLKILCPCGLHNFVYTVTLCDVYRLLDTDKLAEAPSPKIWGVFKSSEAFKIVERPIEDDFDAASLRAHDLTLIYRTAGRYYNSMDASDELRNLPIKRGLKSKVVTEESVSDEESDDTEYGSDGEPMERKPKKARRAKKKKVPNPEVVEYRKMIVQEQAKDAMEIFTVRHLGKELCSVFAQILRCCENGRTSSREAYAFMYTSRHWLQTLEDQARNAGSEQIEAVARRMLSGAGTSFE